MNVQTCYEGRLNLSWPLDPSPQNTNTALLMTVVKYNVFAGTRQFFQGLKTSLSSWHFYTDSQDKHSHLRWTASTAIWLLNHVWQAWEVQSHACHITLPKYFPPKDIQHIIKEKHQNQLSLSVLLATILIQFMLLFKFQRVQQRQTQINKSQNKICWYFVCNTISFAFG